MKIVILFRSNSAFSEGEESDTRAIRRAGVVFLQSTYTGHMGTSDVETPVHVHGNKKIAIVVGLV